MKRKIKVLSLLLVLAMLLTACNKEGNEPEAEDTAVTSADEAVNTAEYTETTKNTENTEDTEATLDDFEERTTVKDKSQFPTDLYGLAVDNISPDEMTEVRRYNEDFPWDIVTCEGFTYIAEPTGINYNSIDNSDIFNSEDDSFTGSKTESEAMYKRYNVGDEICGLTVDYAMIRFQYGENYGELKEKYFGGGVVQFKGEKELNGYLIILSDDIYAVGGEGDIIFIPDNSSQTLPVVAYTGMSEDRGAYSTKLDYTQTISGLAFKNEYGFISCDNVTNYDDSLFLGAEHNKPLKAAVVIEDIYMSANIDWFSNISASIKSVKFS